MLHVIQHGSGAKVRRNGGRTAAGAPGREAESARSLVRLRQRGPEGRRRQEAASAREYDDKLEGELQKIHDSVLALVDRSLHPPASIEESTVICYKTKGEAKSEDAEDGCVAYAEAKKITEKFINKDVDVPVMMQRQEPVTQKVWKTVEVPQVQYVHQIIDVPVVVQCQVLTSQIVKNTVEAQQVQFLDRVVDVPVVMQRRRSVPQTMEEFMEVIRLTLQDRMQERIVEETDVHLSRMIEKKNRSCEARELHGGTNRRRTSSTRDGENY